MSKKIQPLYLEGKKAFGSPDFVNGGRADAFRHCFYMAAFAQKVKVKKLRRFGILHERGNYKSFKKYKNEDGEVPDSLGSVMDLFNNELGFRLGNGNKKANLQQLQQMVIQAILNGDAKIMKRKKNGLYLSCNNEVINLQNFTGRWAIPKCLVPSNTPYMD